MEKNEKRGKREEKKAHAVCTEAKVTGIDSCWEISLFCVLKITPLWATDLRLQLNIGQLRGGKNPQ